MTSIQNTRTDKLSASRRITAHRWTMAPIAVLVCCVAALQKQHTVSAFVMPACSQRAPTRELAQPHPSHHETTRAVPRVPQHMTTALRDIADPNKTPSPLNAVERYCVSTMERWYAQSQAIKCPFFRRRTSDILDGMDAIMRFIVIRHKSLDFIGPPMGCRTVAQTSTNGQTGTPAAAVAPVKLTGLSIHQVADALRHDWTGRFATATNKGYYITGKLNVTIYCDDCIFDGPDPDMPVCGVRKYTNAASQLFDVRHSQAELLSLDVHDEGIVRAEWRLQGVLRLPWRPHLPTYTGSTLYHVNEDGLIYRHEEQWNMTVLRAFVETLLPGIATRVWKRDLRDAVRS